MLVDNCSRDKGDELFRSNNLSSMLLEAVDQTVARNSGNVDTPQGTGPPDVIQQG